MRRKTEIRDRKLKPDEVALWQKVKRTVEPLPGKNEDFETLLNSPQDTFSGTHNVQDKPGFKPGSKTPPPQMPSYTPPVSSSKNTLLSTTSQPAPSEIDDRTASKLIKGRVSIDARIDLHGMTQIQAHDALLAFVQNAFFNKARIVLVITGKGRTGEGILRNQVPHWLREPVFSNYVSAFRQAHVTHGGSGALYVRIRKNHGASK